MFRGQVSKVKKGIRLFLVTVAVVGIALGSLVTLAAMPSQAAQNGAGEAAKDRPVLIAEGWHSLGLRSDGTLWAWGQNDSGQLGLGDTTDRNSPEQVGSDSNWVAVAGGGWHSLGLRSDGTLWSWGANDFGKLGLGDTTDRNSPEQVGSASNWVAVAAGEYHSLGLRSDGTLWAWGANGLGQLGLGDNSDRNTPQQVGSDSNWVAVVGGWRHSLGLRSDGTLWAWGRNNNGQLGLGDTTQRNTPQQVGSDSNWVAVAAGEDHSLGLRSDGTLWAWGHNGYGELGLGDTDNRNTPQQVGSASNWVAVAAGVWYSLGLRSDGTLWAWGLNDYGQLGLGDNNNRNTPEQLAFALASPPSVTTTPASPIAETGATLNGDLTALGKTDLVAAAGGWRHSLGLRSDGTLWAWGLNGSGQLGLGDNTDRNIPVQVGSDSNWVAVAPRGVYSLGLRSDGTLWAWGYNRYGELGLGDNNDRNTPVQVGSDSNWVEVSAGVEHCLGLRSDGTLWAWGLNDFGQLGLGDNNDRNTPVQVGSYSKWVAVAGGWRHSLGLRSDGTLWAWGNNTSGQLGLGDNTDRNTPQQVGSYSKWVAVAAGDVYSLGLRSDGTLWAWGWNSSGQLGLGDNNDRNTPQQVGGASNWVAVAAGWRHSLGLRSDGTLWAWGLNEFGELGLGDNNQRNSPQKVGSASNWVAVAAGEDHSLGLGSDGTLWAWGLNEFGELGLGDNNDRNRPVQVVDFMVGCQVWFEWGLTTAYGESTSPVTVNSSGTFSAPISELSEGVTYNFRACARNSGGTSYGTNQVFTTLAIAPEAPIDLAASPSGWSNNNDFTVAWSNPTDPSGIAGAYYKLDSVPNYATDGSYVAGSGITSISGIAVTGNGPHQIYVWLRDGADNVDQNNRASTTLYYDISVPEAPVISSATHPVEGTWYSNNDPSFNWTTPADIAGIAGYSYALDQVSNTTPDTTVDTTDNSLSYTDLSNGSWYFHVRAGDNAGNWSDAGHYLVDIGTPPMAVDDAYSTNEDTALNVSAPGVLGNDSDGVGEQLSALLVSDVSHGALTLNADGSFSYTPGANFNGTDSFTYQASDGVLQSNVATVTITVVPVNDVPVAANDAYSINEDTALNVSAPGVLGNDSDADEDQLTAVVVSTVSHGSLTLNANGSFSYTPSANFNGTDSFTYRASDGVAQSNTATVTITVVAMNDVPVAANDAYSTSEDTVLNVAAPGVLGNDSDADEDQLTAVVVSTVSHGSLTLNANGSFSYTPGANFNGTDSFTYKANDGVADSNVATVTITVKAAPTIASLDPQQSRAGETTTVIITGTNLTGATEVDFGSGITVSSFTVDSATQITASITIAASATTGARDVSVVTPGGTGTLPDGFTVEEKTAGEVGGCACSSVHKGVSARELLLGWGIIGLCWASGYYLVRRVGKRRK